MTTVDAKEPELVRPPDAPTASTGSYFGIVAAYTACILIWGTTWYAIRVCVAPGAFSPLFAGAVRFTIAGPICILIWLAIRPHASGSKTMLWTGAAALASALSLACTNTAEQWISGGLASIINSTAPLVMAVMATLFGIERVHRNSIVGCVTALIGVLVIFSDRLHVSADQAAGVLLMLLGIVLSAVNGVIVKRHANHQHPATSLAIFACVSAAAFWLLTANLERFPMSAPLPTLPLAAAAYLAVFSSVIAFGCWLYLLKRISLMAVTTLVFFPPLIALALDACVEKGCSLAATSYAGIGITLIGVAFSLLMPRSESAVYARDAVELDPALACEVDCDAPANGEAQED